MSPANITWLVKSNSNDYSISNDYYAGSLDGNIDTSLFIQVWNNYRGFENIQNLSEAKLVIKTLNIDDSYLFDYLSIKIDGVTKTLNKYDKTKYFVNIGSLSGAVNNGSELTQETLSNKNMCNIELIFHSIDFKVKDSLKNIILDIESNT